MAAGAVSEVGAAASVLSKIEAVLSGTKADERKWCVDGSIPAIMPALTIAGVGHVALPLLPESEQVHALSSCLSHHSHR